MVIGKSGQVQHYRFLDKTNNPAVNTTRVYSSHINACRTLININTVAYKHWGNNRPPLKSICIHEVFFKGYSSIISSKSVNQRPSSRQRYFKYSWLNTIRIQLKFICNKFPWKLDNRPISPPWKSPSFALLICIQCINQGAKDDSCFLLLLVFGIWTW